MMTRQTTLSIAAKRSSKTANNIPRNTKTTVYGDTKAKENVEKKNQQTGTLSRTDIRAGTVEKAKEKMNSLTTEGLQSTSRSPRKTPPKRHKGGDDPSSKDEVPMILEIPENKVEKQPKEPRDDHPTTIPRAENQANQT